MESQSSADPMESTDAIAVTQRSTWMPTLISPYVPGLSERLRFLSAKCGVRTWLSYGGKTCDSLTHFKEQYHRSKAQHAVYMVSCECGCHYIGESMRNLKIRIHEHELKSSKSTISLHILEENEKLRKLKLPQTH